MAPAMAPQERQRIALGVRSEGNAALIREIVADHEIVAYQPQALADGTAEFDLAIVDGPTLARSREALAACRAAADPVIIPALLVVDARGGGAALAQELGHSVDDILRVPVSRRELRARVDNLLRLRALSRQQHARFEQANEALAGANRALQVLQAGNEVLLRAEHEQELLEAICRIIVERNRYALAWVGFVRRDEDPEIVPAAVAGESCTYVDHVRLTFSAVSGGPAWRSIQDGRTVVAPDLAGDPTLPKFVQDQVRAHALGSVVTLFIEPEDGSKGVLAIYSRRVGDFGADERDLLERLAGNLEYGIKALRAEAERQRQKEAIKSLAYEDAVTGLPNRHYLIERLDVLLGDEAQPTRAAVLFVDLDDFKIINDALGHAAGDIVLRQIAQRLDHLVRPHDFVVRQGGDEFILVMAEEPRSQKWGKAVEESAGLVEAARAMGERVAERLADPLTMGDYERRIGASIGISLCPDHGRNASDLIDRADTAMYAAKTTGGRVRLYSDALSEKRERRLSMEDRLYSAFESDEFRLHYQPVFDLETGAIDGVEALLRWPQPDGSFVQPGEFMPVAEETGLIVCLGDWILRTAIAQRAAWLAEGHDLLMAINVSVRQLKAEDAAERLLVACAGAIDPTRIELEVTEGDLADESDRVQETLETLHTRGFRIAVDDFGTGYSSLSRLQAMPITTLKIDQEFVAGAGHDGRGAVIARAIQNLADGLGLRCLAEGIETDFQRRFLLDTGCRVGQGFWLSRAVPPETLIEMVRKQTDTPGTSQSVPDY